MAGDRMAHLLLAAAEALEDGTDPFATEWLSEREVSLEEVYELAELCAYAIRTSLMMRARLAR